MPFNMAVAISLRKLYVADATILCTEALPEGKVTLKTEFIPDGSGTRKLLVNGKPAGEGKVKRSTFRHARPGLHSKRRATA